MQNDFWNETTHWLDIVERIDEKSVNLFRDFCKDLRISEEKALEILKEIALYSKGNSYKAVHMILLLSSSGTKIIDEMLARMDVELKYHVGGILGDLKPAGATKLLLRLLMDKEPDIRHVSIFSLGKIGDLDSVPVLLKVRDTDYGEDFEGRKINEIAQEAIDKILSKS